jgi:drug/metabolite transporter (DMT)-like permease
MLESLWIIFCVLCVVAWGGQYTVSHVFDAKKPSPFLVIGIVSIVTLLTSIVGQLIWMRIKQTSWADEWRPFREDRYQVFACAIGYGALSSAGNVFYLIAKSLSPNSTGLITVITSLYEVVTMIMTFILWQEYKNLDLRLAIPSLILAPFVVVMLVLSRKSDSQPATAGFDSGASSVRNSILQLIHIVPAQSQ